MVLRWQLACPRWASRQREGRPGPQAGGLVLSLAEGPPAIRSAALSRTEPRPDGVLEVRVWSRRHESGATALAARRPSAGYVSLPSFQKVLHCRLRTRALPGTCIQMNKMPRISPPATRAFPTESSANIGSPGAKVHRATRGRSERSSQGAANIAINRALVISPS